VFGNFLNVYENSQTRVSDTVKNPQTSVALAELIEDLQRIARQLIKWAITLKLDGLFY
jgi:argininosuccinate lyase